MFFNELTDSALKKTKPRQKKPQLSYKVPDICTQVCSSSPRLVKCVLFTVTHAPLCAHPPLYIVPHACYFGGNSPQGVQTLPGWLGTTQLQTQTAARPLLSVHTEQLSEHPCCVPAALHWASKGLRAYRACLWLWADHSAEVIISVYDLYQGGNAMLCCVMWACSWGKLGNPCMLIS